MGTKILIVDDEPDIVAMLSGFFTGKGYQVLTAQNGREALKKAEQSPDLILLDVAMPEMDGLAVCQAIRDRLACPILFLTARIEDADKVRGFSAGGDDYILKPFSLGELAIDYLERRLFFGQEEIPLTKKEFDIVELLSQNPGQVFDKERIYEKIWGYDSEGSSGVVAEHIRRIRAKLAVHTDRVYLETVWGCGYKWNR